MAVYATSRQSDQGAFTPLLITPSTPTDVTLQMHTADFQITYQAGTLALDVNALYRLHNASDNSVLIAVTIAPAEPSSSSALANSVDLQANGQPLTLALTNTQATAQVPIGADGQVDLALRYTVDDWQAAQLPTLSYALSTLRQWQGAPSVRISLALPATIPSASWSALRPDGWHYFQAATLSSDTTDPATGIKWLFDAQLPTQPFEFQFIHPTLWNQIIQRTQAVQESATPVNFLQLGDLYQQLLASTPVDAQHAAVRERFYAQALATYTMGIEKVAATASANDLATLYLAVAALYRNQISHSAAATAVTYAQATVDAAEAARTHLAENDPRQRELAQWLADGLQLMLTDAQQQQDWTRALAIADQLALLPPEVADPALVEKTKRSFVVQQALQLLEEDHRVAAMALAGDEIRDTALLPPPSAHPLFSRWTMTTTVTPQQIEIDVVGTPIVEYQNEAQAALTTLVDLWRQAASNRIDVTFQPGSTVGDANAAAPWTPHFTIRTPVDLRLDALLAVIPPKADWALIRTLLEQVQPSVQVEPAWLSRQWTLTQRLDLQGAAEQWSTMHTMLEKQALQFDREAASFNSRDENGAEDALRAHIQAANYRTAANQWRQLADESWVALQLAAPSGLQQQVRTALLTVSTPVQELVLQTAPSALGIFLSIVGLALVGLLLLTATLWWLL
ncbi:MAG: hypothetical protein R3C14_01275 [Caldilineaceae bacterium]